MLHLDSIYRNRYQEYILTTGEIADSRKTNWRLTEWEKVIGIKTHIRNNVFSDDCIQKPSFKCFLNFRWGGKEAIGHKKYKDIKIWTVGWTDGIICYLNDYDFKLGIKLKEYTMKLNQIKSHIHPRIINLGILK